MSYSISLYCRNETSDKRMLQFSNIKFALHTQANLWIEQNWEEWNNCQFFSGKLICLQLIVEDKILNHQLSSGPVASPNQGRRQRYNCLQGLNGDKDFLSKFIFSHEAYGRVKKETMQCHTVLECKCAGFSCFTNF